jgi:hypothetical protein
MSRILTATRARSSGPLQQIRSSAKLNDYVKEFPGQHTSWRLAYRAVKKAMTASETVPTAVHASQLNK